MKENNEKSKKQVMYLGRWVDKEHFRAFVYKSAKEMKLARSYDEFENLLATGVWFDSPDAVPQDAVKSIRKSKNESSIPIS